MGNLRVQWDQRNPIKNWRRRPGKELEFIQEAHCWLEREIFQDLMDWPVSFGWEVSTHNEAACWRKQWSKNSKRVCGTWRNMFTCLSLTPETSICLRECERNRVPMITFGKVLKFRSCILYRNYGSKEKNSLQRQKMWNWGKL